MALVGYNPKDSSYRKRINKVLAGKTFKFDPKQIVRLRQIHEGKQESLTETIVAGEVWKLEPYVKIGNQKCELCGHNPIRNIFTIVNKQTHQKLEIGCECAKNYADADLVDGIVKEFRWEYNKIVNPIRFENEIPALQWGCENRRKLPYTLRANYKVYNMIGAGSPGDILRKIERGKYIAKREQEVIKMWVDLYAKADEVLANEENLKEAYIEEQRKRQEEYHKAIALRNLAKFFSDIDTWEEARKAYQHIDQAKENVASHEDSRIIKAFEYAIQIGRIYSSQVYALNELASRKQEHDKDEARELFAKIYEAEAGNKFVNSVYGYYKRHGFVTEKQLGVLHKIADKVA